MAAAKRNAVQSAKIGREIRADRARRGKPERKSPVTIWEFLLSIENEPLRANLLMGRDAVGGSSCSF